MLILGTISTFVEKIEFVGLKTTPTKLISWRNKKNGPKSAKNFGVVVRGGRGGGEGASPPTNSNRDFTKNVVKC